MLLYKTINQEARIENIVEKSKFIAYIKPVDNREEAEEFIKQIKNKHKDATHNVPAMIIGDKMQIQWASDDGEPQGTSGYPILSMLVNEEITNIAIVVTRYFGGIKLGTGGLVRAYSGSAKMALEKAGRASVKEVACVSVSIEYNYFSSLQKLCDNKGYKIENIKYEEKIIADCLTDSENIDNMVKHITELTSGRAEFFNRSIKIAKVLDDK